MEEPVGSLFGHFAANRRLRLPEVLRHRAQRLEQLAEHNVLRLEARRVCEEALDDGEPREAGRLQRLQATCDRVQVAFRHLGRHLEEALVLDDSSPERRVRDALERDRSRCQVLRLRRQRMPIRRRRFPLGRLQPETAHHLIDWQGDVPTLHKECSVLLHEHIDRVQVLEQGCPIAKASRKGC